MRRVESRRPVLKHLVLLGRRVFVAVDRDANDISTCCVQRVNLGDSSINVLRMSGGHALDRDWMTGADLYRADSHLASWVTLDGHGVTLREPRSECCLFVGLYAGDTAGFLLAQQNSRLRSSRSRNPREDR